MKGNHGWHAVSSSGGLVSALSPVLRDRGGLWIGWSGTAETEDLTETLREVSELSGFDMIPVPLNERQVYGYYQGFANEITWPLFHGFETRCNFENSYWEDYSAVNQRFAEMVVKNTNDDDFLWIHDYHLMLVGEEIKRRRPGVQCGFFLHIPFPSPDIFFKLPWRKQILEGLLAYDLIGFQTLKDRRNFTLCLRELRLPGLNITGRGRVVRINFGGRNLKAGVFPISVDFKGVEELTLTEKVKRESDQFREKFKGRRIILGMDRLDYTKGIPQRLQAYRTALEQHPEMLGNASFVQHTVPSREGVPEYEKLRVEIEQLVGEINGEFTRVGDWIPIHYIHRSLDRELVFAGLRSTDIAIVTPLRDGMNLVAKEYCAAKVDLDGVLILSEFAGVAAEFKRNSLLVNPYDIQGVADAIHRAFHMGPEEMKRRMRSLRRIVRRHDVFDWVDQFLAVAGEARQLELPPVEGMGPFFRLSPMEEKSSRNM